MALYNSADIKDVRYLLSQTPPNFIEQNYYLNEMQMKVDADWPYRPNRKVIEEECEVGTEEYSPIEVVVQSVKNDKGESVSDDWYRLVFRNCRRHNQIGHRYRFSYVFDPEEDDKNKNVWIGMNQTSLSSTSAQVVCRCNGTIGSIYVDEAGETRYHYEPVIQPTKLNSSGFEYSEVAIDPDGDIALIAQYNKYTKQYYINQRFVIGTSYVYKVNNIIKSDSRTTYDPEDVGIMRIYLSMDQVGKLDDLENRIAYNGREDEPKPVMIDGGYELEIIEPSSIPEVIPESGVTLKAVVKNQDGTVVEKEITCEARLSGNKSEMFDVTEYCQLTNNGDGTFTIRRKKVSMTLDVVLTFLCIVSEEKTLALDVVFALRPF